MEATILQAIADSLSDYPCFITPAQLLGVILYRWARKLGAEATDYLTIWLKKRFTSTKEKWEKWVNRVGPLPTSVSHVLMDEDVLEVVIDSFNMMDEDVLEVVIDSSNLV